MDNLSGISEEQIVVKIKTDDDDGEDGPSEIIYINIDSPIIHVQEENQEEPSMHYNLTPMEILTAAATAVSGPGNGTSSGASMEVLYSSSTTVPPPLAHHGHCGPGGTLTASAAELPDTKECIEELCPVCGDKVSGYHYGLLTCESCKGFFKRTVQNKKVYTCVAERSCHIDKTQRKRCPYCRFQKCLEVGMKLEAVRADRMRGGRNKFGPMYKRDRARKLQMMRQRQMAAQTLRTSQYGLVNSGASASTDGIAFNYQSPFSTLNIKQEIQIPQVSSLTSSPDSSPSPIAVALSAASGAVGSVAANGPLNSMGSGIVVNPQQQQHQQQQHISVPSGALQIQGSGVNLTSGSGTSDGGSNNSGSNGTAPPGISLSEHKLNWNSSNSSATSPHAVSPKTFQFDGSNGAPSQQPPTPNNNNNNNKLMCSSPSPVPLIREFIQGLDDREWQNSLFSLLQNQTYNQCEVDLFELMCKVLDQNLFSQVDWARNSSFFKDLKVDDQMKLLQHSWSDMLVLDHIHQRMHNNLPDETTLHNGQKFDLLSLGLLGIPGLQDQFTQITLTLHDLKFDISDYICLKFLLLLNPDVRGLMNKRHVQEGHELVRQTLLDYCITSHPQIQEKFMKLMSILPNIHDIATRGEDHLYQEHCTGNAPTQTLLMEMLHAKRK